MQVFQGRQRPSSQALRSFFLELFFRSPWHDLSLPSLVYERSNGTIAGFLGVVPRPMTLNNRLIRLAVATQFMVAPDARATLAAVQLLKALFSGPQDLTVCDAFDHTRRLSEALGGTTSPLHSIYWLRPLRPSRYLMWYLKDKRELFRPIERLSRPLCRGIDALASHFPPQSRLRRCPQSLSEEDLTVDAFLSCLSNLPASAALRPDYDVTSLKWLLDWLSHKTNYGSFQKVLLRTPTGGIAGWYLCYNKPDGISELLQVMAHPDSASDVLDYLFHTAWRQGAIAVQGRLQPRLLGELSTKHCLFTPGRYLMLIHSKRPELLQAVLRDDLFLTRLEGEWFTYIPAHLVA